MQRRRDTTFAARARRFSEAFVYRKSTADTTDVISHGPLSGICGVFLIVISWTLLGLSFPFSLAFCFKIVKEYERAVVFRLGRLLPGGARGPGLFFVLPCVDTFRKIDLRVVSFAVPPQEILSKDSVGLLNRK